MKKNNYSIPLITLSVISALASMPVIAEDIPAISIEATKISDVSGDEVKSADLADALTRRVPTISIIRRSGIANDIILRGQNKDNINVLYDDAKIYGACPNRMDAPISHILTNNIDSIEIIEGPYDVENFGTLSGAVKVSSKKPEKDLHGEVSVNFGSWSYERQAMTITGGNDQVRGLVTVSHESSDQYRDGNGDDFAEQMDKQGVSTMTRYKDQYRNLDAYTKKTFMSKFYIDLVDNQEMGISYTANRSDDVLYPSSKMDAKHDDSNILNLDYTISNLGEYSKKLYFQYYDSDVDHPMSNFYRNASGPGSVKELISKLTTRMQGFKAKNTFDLDPTMEMTIGLDTSKRNWDGKYTGYFMGNNITGRISIDDVDTKNNAIFAELEKRYSGLTLNFGARYDDSTIEPDGSDRDNDYNSFSAFANASWQYSDTTTFSGGVGKSSRVPDARELYWVGPSGAQGGTPDLDETRNYEIDLGMENNFLNLTLKTKVFYSWLKDYIYYNAGPIGGPAKTVNNFENIDATIYGFDISGVYSFTDNIYMDFGLAYQRGEKDKPLQGQTDKDLANITPLKLNMGLNYDYYTTDMSGTARVEFVGTDTWDHYDSDNGEQKLAGWGVMNMKVTHNLNRNFEITAGIDNVFDKTYAINNTYKDLTLLISGGGDVTLLNEPGRYYYINAAFKF